MRLSALQKYILLECLNTKISRLNRKNLVDFYKSKKNKPDQMLWQKIITKSIERLISKDLLVGFGEKTATKLFIHEIKLTLRGKKQAKKLLGEQLSIPLKHKNLKVKISK